LLRPLFQYLKPYRWKLAPVVLASALEMFFNAQIPMSVKFIIDKALIGHNERMMLLILMALAASTLVVSSTSLWRDYLYAKIVGSIVTAVRQHMFEHLQQLSMDFYAKAEIGDVMSRFSNDVAAVEVGLASGVSWGLQPLMDLALSAALVFTLQWKLATLGILLCPICVLGPRLLQKRATEANVRKQEEESGIMSALQQTLMAPAVVRAFGLQEPIIARFTERNKRLFGASIRLGFLTSLMERSASIGTLLLQAVVMGISGYMAFRGRITVGTFASFQALFVSLSYSFMYLAQYLPSLINAAGGVIRIEELQQLRASVEDAPGAQELAPLKGAIEFRDVVFSYTGDRPNLDRVSLRIPRGSSVALVGPSGSGKSTALNLLLRFYDPTRGAVTFDGVDLRMATAASLHAQTAVVFQESFLFNTSVRENIAMGRPDATEEKIAAAAKAAHIHDFIAGLPEGYDTMAGERGSRFSGGQRQRIAIARAVLRNPEILVLDEATSALDAANEHAINETLEQIAGGRTVVSVTHRLSSVVHADRIFLFDHGRLAEQGSHGELVKADGLYAKLWHKQSGVHVSEGELRATVDTEWLSELPLMKGVSTEALAEMAQWFATEAFPQDRAIVQQGDAGNAFYILVRGTVEVTREEDGRIEPVATLEDGDYFGEMALLSDQPRNATVRTLTPCVCLTLARELFERLLAREPELREHVHAVAVARGVQETQLFGVVNCTRYPLVPGTYSVAERRRKGIN
jgi:ATP-binding cassette subfamily B protein